jgi:hypothetical protein
MDRHNKRGKKIGHLERVGGDSARIGGRGPMGVEGTDSEGNDNEGNEVLEVVTKLISEYLDKNDLRT